ncbi:uncharacterized protein LOC115899659 isoform X2 [Rhinopithecus roxellana]|uniref:uncharacterized protein LOC115899659 isoform X2 n=1 Tax=Rhinopithecus roxellana TaxID=61622 RepID=UPI0012375A0E|nr:uncharacterized protein LOC115899659 isoform X2 [Rhinopithecus roxellana]
MLGGNDASRSGRTAAEEEAAAAAAAAAALPAQSCRGAGRLGAEGGAEGAARAAALRRPGGASSVRLQGGVGRGGPLVAPRLALRALGCGRVAGAEIPPISAPLLLPNEQDFWLLCIGFSNFLMGVQSFAFQGSQEHPHRQFSATLGLRLHHWTLKFPPSPVHGSAIQDCALRLPQGGFCFGKKMASHHVELLASSDPPASASQG